MPRELPVVAAPTKLVHFTPTSACACGALGPHLPACLPLNWMENCLKTELRLTSLYSQAWQNGRGVAFVGAQDMVWANGWVRASWPYCGWEVSLDLDRAWQPGTQLPAPLHGQWKNPGSP